MSWLDARVLHPLDQLSYRLTRGRHTFSSWLSGLPVVMVTTAGAKTGQQRTWPVIAVPDGDHPVVLRSNWGQRQHPAWYYNLRAYPTATATVTVGGVPRRVLAHEASGRVGDRPVHPAAR